MNDVTSSGLQRNAHIDSTKGALILLVVFGHMLEVFVRDPLYRAIYSAIYLFHMPLFVMTSGMFSRARLGDKDYAGILTRLVIPLILFQCLYLAPLTIGSGHAGMLTLRPYWILWFLLSLACWKLVLPFFARLPFPVTIAVLLALAAGFVDKIGYALSLSRTFYFLPFFVAGFAYKDRILDLAARHRAALAVLFVALMAVMAYWSLNGLDHSALWGSLGYALAPVLPAFPAGGRLLVLGLSFLGAVGFLAVVRESRMLAYLGTRSLAIYLVHGFVIKGFANVVGRTGVPAAPWLVPVWLLAAVLVAVVLAPLDKWLLRLYEWISAGLSGVAAAVRKRVLTRA